PAPAAQDLRAIPDPGSRRCPHARPPAIYTIPPAFLRDLAGFSAQAGLAARGAAAATRAPLRAPWGNRSARFAPAPLAGAPVAPPRPAVPWRTGAVSRGR